MTTLDSKHFADIYAYIVKCFSLNVRVIRGAARTYSVQVRVFFFFNVRSVYASDPRFGSVKCMCI